MADGHIPKPILANVNSLELVSTTFTTDATGNVPCSLVNDGKTVVFGCYCDAGTYVVLPFVSSTNNTWYVKIRDAESMEPIPNAEVYLRYYVLRMN